MVPWLPLVTGVGEGLGLVCGLLGWAERGEQQFDGALGLEEIFAFRGLGCAVVPQGQLPSVLRGCFLLPTLVALRTTPGPPWPL